MSIRYWALRSRTGNVDIALSSRVERTMEAWCEWLGTLSRHLCGGGCACSKEILHSCDLKHVKTVAEVDVGRDQKVMGDTEDCAHLGGDVRCEMSLGQLSTI